MEVEPLLVSADLPALSPLLIMIYIGGPWHGCKVPPQFEDEPWVKLAQRAGPPRSSDKIYGPMAMVGELVTQIHLYERFTMLNCVECFKWSQLSRVEAEILLMAGS